MQIDLYKRKLVSIQKILDINPIENADLIETVTIKGWQVVVQKSSNFKINDLVVYFEIDSMLPIIPEFEFLRKSCYRKLANDIEGFRIKTIKLKGIYSQGLIISINELYKIINKNSFILEEETDLTELLKVIKYEPPIPACLEGLKKENTPEKYVPDEIRIQNLQPLLDKYKGTKCYTAEKLDGSASIFYIDENNELNVASKGNVWLPESQNSQWKWANKINIKEKLLSLPFRACISGEIIGEGIQGNKYKLLGQEVYVYDIKNLEINKYLDLEDMQNIAKSLNLKTVPILEYIDLTDNINTLLQEAEGYSILNNKIKREGIVIRPIKTIIDNTLGVPHDRISFKVISNSFLLKENN